MIERAIVHEIKGEKAGFLVLILPLLLFKLRIPG